MARVDFAWPELGVFVEFDGKVKYEALLKPGRVSRRMWSIREKRREERIVELTGWTCIRVTWSDLENPEALLAAHPQGPGSAPRSDVPEGISADPRRSRAFATA